MKYKVAYHTKNLSNNLLSDNERTFDSFSKAVEYIRSLKSKSEVHGTPTLETINA